MAKKEMYALRVSSEQLERWRGAAAAEDLAVSEWIRRACEVAVGDGAPVLSVVRAEAEVKTAQPAKPAAVSVSVLPSSSVVKEDQCPRWFHHKKGTICKLCGFY